MLMKIFNKGQVVIPSEIRKALDISVGDLIHVTVDRKKSCIQLRPHTRSKSRELAGSLAKYARKKKFPTRRYMHEVLQKGLDNAA